MGIWRNGQFFAICVGFIVPTDLPIWSAPCAMCRLHCGYIFASMVSPLLPLGCSWRPLFLGAKGSMRTRRYFRSKVNTRTRCYFALGYCFCTWLLALSSVPRGSGNSPGQEIRQPTWVLALSQCGASGINYLLEWLI